MRRETVSWTDVKTRSLCIVSPNGEAIFVQRMLIRMTRVTFKVMTVPLEVFGELPFMDVDAIDTVEFVIDLTDDMMESLMAPSYNEETERLLDLIEQEACQSLKV